MTKVDPWWWPVVLTSGVGQGRTVGWWYAHDQATLRRVQVAHPVERRAVLDALAHQRRVDPWYDDAELLNLGRLGGRR